MALMFHFHPWITTRSQWFVRHIRRSQIWFPPFKKIIFLNVKSTKQFPPSRSSLMIIAPISSISASHARRETEENKGLILWIEKSYNLCLILNIDRWLAISCVAKVLFWGYRCKRSRNCAFEITSKLDSFNPKPWWKHHLIWCHVSFH